MLKRHTPWHNCDSSWEGFSFEEHAFAMSEILSMCRSNSYVQSSSCPQEDNSKPITHVGCCTARLAPGWSRATEDECKVWNMIAEVQRTTLWLNHWCSALPSNGCVCSSSGLGILTSLINKHSECSKCNWFSFHREVENVSHSTWIKILNDLLVHKCYHTTPQPSTTM